MKEGERETERERKNAASRVVPSHMEKEGGLEEQADSC